ncbi:hypothetical protein BRADI_3g23343v3 [Brachypodium distachyon]|uniref:Uncharacterized protein n=1 Tax=Brachypodium distachyon TaxID=15368 RepID=A0A2K2CZ25_BRADI|nr:hypothetical protein BRADI_3g23343v3 [Brachypodium distachyon]
MVATSTTNVTQPPVGDGLAALLWRTSTRRWLSLQTPCHDSPMLRPLSMRRWPAFAHVPLLKKVPEATLLLNLLFC